MGGEPKPKVIFVVPFRLMGVWFCPIVPHTPAAIGIPSTIKHLSEQTRWCQATSTRRWVRIRPDQDKKSQLGDGLFTRDCQKTKWTCVIDKWIDRLIDRYIDWVIHYTWTRIRHASGSRKLDWWMTWNSNTYFKTTTDYWNYSSAQEWLGYWFSWFGSSSRKQ